MKSFMFALLICLMSASVHAETEPSVMVWQLEAGSGVDQASITTISGFITGHVQQHFKGEVISEADIKTILKGEESRNRCGVQDTSCIAEIGAALGTVEAISGDLGHIGDYWIINLRRIDVRQARIVDRVTRNIKGDINALIEAIPAAVKELLSKASLYTKKPIAPSERFSLLYATKPQLSVMEKAGWGLFGSGAILVIAGGMFKLIANDKRKTEYNNDVENADIASTVVFSLGGASLAAGISLLIADALLPADSQASLPLIQMSPNRVEVVWRASW